MLHYHRRIRLSLFIILVLVASASFAFVGETHGAASTVNATGDDIIHRLVEANERRAQALRHYTEERHYQVQFSGFPSNLAASMDVEATYDAPSTKSFRIISQTGSKLLIDHVLKKLLDAEKESAKDPSRTELTPRNYNFTLERTDTTLDGKLYVFHVEPRVNRKFLYRGTIWVDAADYAVVKIEAEPAANPSFWIKKTMIHHIYAKTGNFWLPKQNRSVTQVRLGGTAALTIDYGPYHIEAAPISR